jgi:hypothetical protein
MIVKIDGREYQVNDVEFVKIPHDKFTNLLDKWSNYNIVCIF